MPRIFSEFKSLTKYFKLFIASSRTSFSMSLNKVEKIEKRELSAISLPSASASLAKFLARYSLTFQLLSPVSWMMMGMRLDLFSAVVKHFAISIRLSMQIILTESWSSMAKFLNYFIYPFNKTSFLTYLQRVPMFRARFLLRIRLSSEIMPTILFKSSCWSLEEHFG